MCELLPNIVSGSDVRFLESGFSWSISIHFLFRRVLLHNNPISACKGLYWWIVKRWTTINLYHLWSWFKFGLICMLQNFVPDLKIDSMEVPKPEPNRLSTWSKPLPFLAKSCFFLVPYFLWQIKMIRIPHIKHGTIVPNFLSYLFTWLLTEATINCKALILRNGKLQGYLAWQILFLVGCFGCHSSPAKNCGCAHPDPKFAET